MAEDPDTLRTQMQHTRTEMGRTIDEIQRRLSPDYMIEQTQEALREAAAEKVENMAQTAEYKMNNWRTGALKAVKDNPIPAAMVGIGLGWLLLSNGNDQDEYDYEDSYYGNLQGSPYTYGSNPRPGPYGPSAYATREDNPDLMREARETISDAAETAGDWVGDTAAQAQRRAGQVAENVRQQADETAGTVRENLSETVSEAEERAHLARIQARQAATELEYETRRRLRRTKRTFWETMDENPLAIGVAALAIGALAGMVIPGTERENELMGDTRDRLLEEASSTAQETLQKAQNVAQQTGQAAVDEAKRAMDTAGSPAPGHKTGTATTGSPSESSSKSNMTT